MRPGPARVERDLRQVGGGGTGGMGDGIGDGDGGGAGTGGVGGAGTGGSGAGTGGCMGSRGSVADMAGLLLSIPEPYPEGGPCQTARRCAATPTAAPGRTGPRAHTKACAGVVQGQRDAAGGGDDGVGSGGEGRPRETGRADPRRRPELRAGPEHRRRLPADRVPQADRGPARVRARRRRGGAGRRPAAGGLAGRGLVALFAAAGAGTAARRCTRPPGDVAPTDDRGAQDIPA